MKKKINCKLLLILLVAFGLRLISLNQSLWLDEGIEWWAVTNFNLKDLLFGFMSGDFNPPAHYLLMWFWVKIFGTSEIAMRLPSVLFGVGTVWLIYKIGRMIDGGNTGLLAAAMAAVNGLLIYYSQESRAYAMTTFLVTGAMYWFLKINKDKNYKGYKNYNNWRYIWFVTFLTLAFYTHYLTWLLIPFLFVFGIKYLLPVVFTIPWWPMLWKQLQVGRAVSQNVVWAKIGETNEQNIGLVMVKFITGRVPFPENWWWQIGVGIIIIGFWLLVGMGVTRIFGGSASWWRGLRNSKTILIVWGFGPLILGGLIGMKIPIFIYFRFIFVLPALILLAANGVGGRWGRFGPSALRLCSGSSTGGLGVIGVFCFFSLLYLFNHNYHREDWKGAVAELHGLDVNPIVIINFAVKPPFDYYDKGRSKMISAAKTTANDLMASRIWYVSYAQPIFQPNDEVRKSLMNTGHKRTYEKHYNGVTLEKWTNDTNKTINF